MQLIKVKAHQFRIDIYLNEIIKQHGDVSERDKSIIRQILADELIIFNSN